MPLPWYADDRAEFPLLYRTGVWAALVLSAAFIGLYAARVSDEARLLATALAATELVLEREQHLSQLDGLAAAAAHELGTPLATITLIIKELQKSAPESAPALARRSRAACAGGGALPRDFAQARLARHGRSGQRA